MNNEWKMVPAALLDRALLSIMEHGIEVDGQYELVEIQKAPVPPASDVEVKPVLWFKPLPGLLAKSNGQCYDVVFAEMPGYQPLYAAAVCPAADQESLRDAIAHAIGGDAYDCTRVWQAWGAGTMSEDDFVPIVDQEDRINDIVEACLGQVTLLTAERDALKYEVRDLKRWRDLALQFDNHRLAALWHLKALLQSPEHEGAAHDFLSSPPLAAHEVVAERDGLLAELSHVREERDSYQRVGIQVQSELTKARELLTEALQLDEKADLWHRVSEYLTHLSAPAAKGQDSE